MLAQAARRAPSVRLVEADMRELPSLGEFDLITCFDDSLNHLPDEEGLVAALRSMASNLAPTGLIVFDLNTLLAYRTTFAVEKAFAQDDITFIWWGESSADAEPGCDAAARIDLFAPVADGLCNRVTCRIQQRHFPPESARGARGHGRTRVRRCARRARRRLTHARAGRDAPPEGVVRGQTRERR